MSVGKKEELRMKASMENGTQFSAKREELIDAHVRWLERYDWDWMITLTFPGCPSKKTAETQFDVWVTQLQNEAGAEDFRWVRATERGAYGDNVHFHCVVGGLIAAVSSQPERWQQLWAEITGGGAHIERFDPQQRGLCYMLKSLRPGEDPEIEFKLPIPGESSTVSGANNEDKGEGKQVAEKTHKSVLKHKKSTKSMHVFGNRTLPAQYLPKTLLGGEPPAAVEMVIRWKIAGNPKPARKSLKNSNETSEG